tara:strand:- start:124 stop:687 length:564 start_codon:yes stop_codon:yes gene_type:complete
LRLIFILLWSEAGFALSRPFHGSAAQTREALALQEGGQANDPKSSSLRDGACGNIGPLLSCLGGTVDEPLNAFPTLFTQTAQIIEHKRSKLEGVETLPEWALSWVPVVFFAFLGFWPVTIRDFTFLATRMEDPYVKIRNGSAWTQNTNIEACMNGLVSAVFLLFGLVPLRHPHLLIAVQSYCTEIGS